MGRPIIDADDRELVGYLAVWAVTHAQTEAYVAAAHILFSFSVDVACGSKYVGRARCWWPTALMDRYGVSETSWRGPVTWPWSPMTWLSDSAVATAAASLLNVRA